MYSLHAFQPLSCRIRESKVLDNDCMHSCQHIKESDTIPAVLFIPLAIDAIRAFWCSIVVRFDEK